MVLMFQIFGLHCLTFVKTSCLFFYPVSTSSGIFKCQEGGGSGQNLVKTDPVQFRSKLSFLEDESGFQEAGLLVGFETCTVHTFLHIRMPLLSQDY